MTTVTETLNLPGGGLPTSARVEVYLAGTDGEPVEGFVNSVSIVSRYTTGVDSNAAWTLDLPANASITPSGTAWRRVASFRGKQVADDFMSVPSSGTYRVDQILTSAPAAINAAFTALQVAKIPDYSTALASDKSISDPIASVWLQGSPTVQTSTVVIEVEAAISVAGIAHGGFVLAVGDNVAFPLHNDSVGSYPAGVTAYYCGKVESGSTGSAGSFTNRFTITGLTPGHTLNYELIPQLVGYSNTVAYTGTPNQACIVESAEKLYLVCGSSVVPFLLGRRHENYVDTPLTAITTTNATQAAALPDGTKVWVADWFGLALVEVDTTYDNVTRSIAIAGGPTGVAIASATVGYYFDATTLKIGEFNPTAATITNASRYTNDASTFTENLALSPDGTRLAYVCHHGGTTNYRLRVLNTSTWALVRDDDTGVANGSTATFRCAWEADSSAVWVALGDGNTVRRYTLASGLDSARTITFTKPAVARVSSAGTMLVVAGVNASTGDNFAYYTLPPAAGAAPTRFDGGDISPIRAVALSSDSWFYLAAASSLLTLFGGTVYCRPTSVFNSEWLKIRMWGAS